MIKKRIIITSTISLILVAILMIGSTYSIFTSTKIDENANVYKTGVLDVTYTLSEDNITLANSVPMDEEEADGIWPYRITITNNGTVPYQFDVTLNDTTSSSSNKIADAYIMTKVGYLQPKSLNECTNNIIKEDVVLPAGESVNIDVRVWVDKSIPNSELNKSFYATLSIDGLAVYNDHTDISNDALSLKYMKQLFNNGLGTGYFKNSAYKTYIKEASFVNYIDTSNAITDESGNKVIWDLSLYEDNTVVGWIEQNDEEGYYNLYIGASMPIYTKSLYGFFSYLEGLNNINCDNLDTSLTINMYDMFASAGNNSTIFTLSLGDEFDTKNVTDMERMFFRAGYSSIEFTLDLGDKFDTSNVTNMSKMFYDAGYGSTMFTLDLGEKFDTSNVTNMSGMFSGAGRSSTVFTLDLGDKFDTSSVTDMSSMFSGAGRSSTMFTLDLGEKFDTSNVTNMSGMFSGAGYSSNVFTLDLGDKFDTSNVTNMSNMFHYVGNANTTFTLDLGDKFDTSNVTNMSSMFYFVGNKSVALTLDLGDKFDTSNVTNMSSMFSYVGSSSAAFTLDLGDKFDTSSVTEMSTMFKGCRSAITTITIRNSSTSSYTNMFQDAATKEGSSITVNYTSDAASIIDSVIATKSDTSNVVKGSLVS